MEIDAGMKIYYFSDTNWEQQLGSTPSDLSQVFYRIAKGTNADDLVLVNYFLGSNSWNGGIAFARNWLSTSQFVSRRGRWSFTRNFPIPRALPENFKLIRLHFGIKSLEYPMSQVDMYGWKLTYSSFIDHVAFLFAHELHHFRRYHLGLHPREGENSANKWALERIRSLNYHVVGVKLIQGKKKKKIGSLFHSHLIVDPYKKYRSLDSGDKLLIKYDPRGYYERKIVTVVRPIRKNSKRVVIETGDGKQWRWPLEWVSLVR